MGPLEALLRERIAQDGPMSFAAYMRLCLYDPEHGYYARGKPWQGAGDFVTASGYSPVLALALARLHAHAQHELGLARSELVEVGAGSGELLRQLAAVLPPEVRLRAVDVQRPALPKGAAWSATLAGLQVQGSIVSNELFDALPVERVTRTSEGLRGAHVDVRDGKLGWALGEPPKDAQGFLDRFGVQLAEGEWTEVPIAAQGMLRDMARALERGLVVTIDYGADARSLPSPAGTLVSYAQHRVADPLAQPGEQDLTAHVPFDALRAWGEELGLSTLAEVPQWRFLGAMGALDGLHGLDALRAKSLVAPGRMGEFRVLVQGKGLGAAGAVLQAKLQREPA